MNLIIHGENTARLLQDKAFRNDRLRPSFDSNIGKGWTQRGVIASGARQSQGFSISSGSVGMKRIVIVLLMVFLITGCESIPFQKELDQPYASIDPVAVRERFKGSLSEHSRLLNTIVFEYNLKTFSGIGFIDLDTAKRTCTFACINQMGMKLFEISVDKDNINTIFALPEFTSKGNFAKTVGEDIKRISFDLVPSDRAEVIRKKFSVVFMQKEGNGNAEYVFSGPGQYLTEKTYFENEEPVWRVSFYEYQNRDGRIYPGGTILKNYKYGYRLIVRLKEISD